MVTYEQYVHRNLTEIVVLDEQGEIQDIQTEIGCALWIACINRGDYEQ